MALISDGLQAGTGFFVSWNWDQEPEKSQYNSAENRHSSPGAEVGLEVGGWLLMFQFPAP